MARPKKLPDGIKKRGDTYYAWFKRNGQTIRRRLSKDLDTATTLVRDLQSRVEKGDWGIMNNDFPWADLKKEFIAWARQSLRGADEYERDIKTFETYQRVTNIKQIDQKYVIGYRNWRLGHQRGKKGKCGTISPRTVNRQVGTLRNMLNKGVEWKRIESNAIAGLKPLRHDNPSKQRRPLSLEEVDRLFKASPAHLLPLWRMFMVTGLRHDELVHLKWSDIDFEQRIVIVRADIAKNHKVREIPLDDEIMFMLKELFADIDYRTPTAGTTATMTEQQARKFSRDHVFVTKANTPWSLNLLRRFYACCKRAGITDAKPNGAVDIHSLRVTFTTLALDHGANPKAVQEILGHSTLSLTMKVYAKATERAKRAAVASIPFAKVSAPTHVVAIAEGTQSKPKAHRKRTSTGSQPQLSVV